jgi:hypothetical protein
MRERRGAVVRAVIAVLVVLVTAAACGGSGRKSSPSAVSTADVVVTSTHGVTVRLAGGAILTIPPGAVSGNGRLIARIGGPQEGTNLSLSGQSVTTMPVLAVAGSQVSFELTGATLVHPAALTIPVDPAALQQAGNAASQPDAVWLAFYDAVGHRWQYVGGRYDPVTHSVSAQVTHLSLWAPFTFAWQQIGTVLRQGLSALLSERATLAPCPGVSGVGVSDSGGPDGPVIGCASQAGASQLTITITSNRGYAMVVPTPGGVTPGPPQYTGYTEFLQTRPDAVQKLGGQYLAPTESLTYTMPLDGSPIVFDAAASVKTYELDVGIELTKIMLNATSFGLSDCLLDNMANSGPLPLSAAPGLLVECIPLLGGVAKDASTALGDFVAAFAFAREYVGAVLDLNGDARSNFSGTVRITRPSLPLPDFYYADAVLPEMLYVSPTYPKELAIDNHEGIAIQSLTEWGPDTMIMTGVLAEDECQPDCAAGPIVQYPVQVVATHPLTCTLEAFPGSGLPQQAYVYSKISVDALSGNPRSDLVGDSVFKACS